MGSELLRSTMQRSGWLLCGLDCPPDRNIERASVSHRSAGPLSTPLTIASCPLSAAAVSLYLRVHGRREAMSLAGPPLAPDQVFVPPGVHPVFPLSLPDVAGPQLLAPWLSSLLFGIFVVQSFASYEDIHHGRKDHWLDLALFAGTVIVSTVTAGLEASEMWRSFVIGRVARVCRRADTPATET